MVVFRLVQRRRLVVGLFPLVSGALALLALTSAAVGACAQDQDVGTTGPGAPDATSAADSASDASAPDLVTNASFEDGIVNGNCGTGWNLRVDENVTRTTSSVAHSGLASCRVCTQAPGVEAILIAERPLPDAGSTIVPSAWFRGVPGGALDGETVTSWVAIEGCFPRCTTTNSPPVAPDASDWLLQDGDQQPVVEAGQGQTSFFYEIHVDGGCVLVDDVSAYAQ